MKKAVLWSLSLGLLVCTGLGLFAVYSIFSLTRTIVPMGIPGLAQSIYQPSLDSKPVIIETKKKTFRIPRNYIWHVAKNEYGNVYRIYLHVSYPEFRPVLEENKEKFEHAHIDKDKLNFEIGIVSAYGSNEVALNRFIRNDWAETKMHKVDLYDGLMVYSDDETVVYKEYIFFRKFSNGQSFLAKCPHEKNSCTGLEYSFPDIVVQYDFPVSLQPDYVRIHENIFKLIDEFITQ